MALSLDHVETAVNVRGPIHRPGDGVACDAEQATAPNMPIGRCRAARHG
jgi:hypothetical protein